MPDPRPDLDWPRTRERLAELGLRDARIVRELEEGAYSPTHRWIVADGAGDTFFVKATVGRALGAHLEHLVHAAGLGDFLPRLVAWAEEADGEPALLVTEDLSQAHWGETQAVDAHALRGALHHAAVAAPPDGVEILDDAHPLASTAWLRLVDDPTPLLATGIADEAWCDRATARLAAASQRIDIAGDHLVHGDLWRQNWCTADRGAVLVDWTGAARGNPLVNASWGECGVRACGGPGGIVFPAGHRGHGPWAAWMSGLAVDFLLECYVERARMPRLHETQLREAIAGIAWASETLGIDAPTPAAGVLPAGPWRP